MIILEKMLMLFLLMLIGYAACKKQMITGEVSRKLSGIIVNIANPAIILSTIADDSTGLIEGKQIIITVVFSFIFYGALLLAAEAVPRLLRADKKDYGMYKVMTVFSNMGYMGFPIILSVYGKEALIYASVFLIPFNLLIYTYGIIVMKKREEGTKLNIKAVFNNGVTACIIMILLLLTGIRIPSLLADTIRSVSGITVPLSMMLIGASLYKVRVRELVTDKRLLLFCVTRLTIVPVLGILILLRFVHNEMLLGVMLVVLATPVGSLTAMLAQEYGGNYLLASKGVTITTLLSVITIPIVFFIIEMM